jgi:hypothetical protein
MADTGDPVSLSVACDRVVPWICQVERLPKSPSGNLQVGLVILQGSALLDKKRPLQDDETM